MLYRRERIKPIKHPEAKFETIKLWNVARETLKQNLQPSNVTMTTDIPRDPDHRFICKIYPGEFV